MKGLMQRIAPALAVVASAAMPLAARAGIDAPASLSFEYVRNDVQVFERLEDVPEGVMTTADAYASSNASEMGPEGVFIWAGFQTEGERGLRTGILLLDIDLSNAPLDGTTPIPRRSWHAEYIEKVENDIVFRGEPIAGDVWLYDIFFSRSDDGALEIDIALVFADPEGIYPGCRAIMQGALITDPSPATLRSRAGLPPDEPDTSVYVDAGCSGDVYLADDAGEGCSCGGEDPDSGGCEGDTGGAEGCEGDTGGSAGCEGDTGGCSDASGSGACSGSSSQNCSTAGRLGRVFRHAPQWLSLVVVFLTRRRSKRSG